MKPLLRILDANYNRAKEGIRVLEDIARFVIQDTGLTERWKRCRHDLTQSILSLPVSYRELVDARESSRDVGRQSFIPDKKKKSQWQDLFISNAKRSQEALRVLEELVKMIGPKYAANFQTLRFRLYDLEKRSLQKL